MAGTLGRELFPIWNSALRPQRGTTPKAAVLYLHKGGTEYECEDCTMFLPAAKRCTIHGPNDVIESFGTCGLFVKGRPLGGQPLSNVTKLESGYVENADGFSCKRCEYFVPGEYDCMKVDRTSPGDDPGIIHPDGCCNAWEALNG